jgi:hypothetical protein
VCPGEQRQGEENPLQECLHGSLPYQKTHPGAVQISAASRSGSGKQ